jgi:nitrogen-specific signal transduction histidine kinase
LAKKESKKDPTKYSSYNFILDTVPNPVVEVDKNLIIKLANKEALFRWPSIVEGKSIFFKIILRENKKPKDCFIEKTFKQKKSQTLEKKTKNSEILHLKSNYIKEKDSERF